jgi:hypothetical protein
MAEYYAHSLPDRPKEEWQRVNLKSSNRSNSLIGLNSYVMEGGFVDAFGAGEWERFQTQ